MPNEPERPVEKLLREAARKRREAAGAPFELHPATRRLLQGEVARQFPEDVPARRPFLAMFWPRMALTGVAAMVLLIGLFSVLPPGPAQKEQLFAKNEEPRPTDTESTAMTRAQPELRKEEFAPASVPLAGTPTVASDKLTETPSTREQVARPAVAAPYTSLPSEAAKEVVTIRAAEVDSARDRANLAGETASLAMAPTSAAASAEPRRFGLASPSGTSAQLKQRSPGTYAGSGPAPGQSTPLKPQGQPASVDALTSVRESTPAEALTPKADFVSLRPPEGQAGRMGQDFVRIQQVDAPFADKGSTRSAADSVMVSFKLEQVGQQLRAIDKDGSVYSGLLQGADQRDLSARTLNQPVAAPSASTARLSTAQTAALSSYYFHLTGTNRSLNQRVVFTGTLVPTNLVQNTTAGLAAADGSLRPTPQAGVLLRLNSSRISGRLLIGETQSVEINAVPAKP